MERNERGRIYVFLFGTSETALFLYFVLFWQTMNGTTRVERMDVE
jgi:hypothetical protein